MSHGDHIETPPNRLRRNCFEHRKSCQRVPSRDEAHSRRAVSSGSRPHAAWRRDHLEFSLRYLQGRSRAGRRAHTSREVASSRRWSATHHVICGLSGGVDSAVAAALVHRAIGDQLTCIFVDTGLLRLHEREQVENDISAAPGNEAHHGRRVGAISLRACRRHRSREEANDHRPHVHRCLRGRSRRPVRRRSFWCRERSIPM